MGDGVFATLAGIGVFIGIVIIGLGVLQFIVGIKLWKGKNWARILTIIFAILGILSGLSSLMFGDVLSAIIFIVIDGLIVWYLAINSETKLAFK